MVEQSTFSDHLVPRITDMPEITVRSVPPAGLSIEMGEAGLPLLAPAFASAVARLAGKLPFGLA